MKSPFYMVWWIEQYSKYTCPCLLVRRFNLLRKAYDEMYTDAQQRIC